MGFEVAVNALSLGSLYALIALGIALVFGIMELINFAYGDLVMVGGYVILLSHGEGWMFVVAATVVAVVVCAVLMERIAFRPVRGADPATLLVTSFAVSYLLQNLARIIFGARPKTVDAFSMLANPVDVGPIATTALDVVTLVVTAAFLGGLALFLTRSTAGIAMRGAAEDFRTARLIGVRANRVIAMAFAISGLAAAIVAMLLLAQSGTISPTIGLVPALVGFVSTVIGGLGRLYGAVIGGYVLGLVTILLQSYLPLSVLPYRDALVFGFVIVLLLLRPQGLFPSRALQERV